MFYQIGRMPLDASGTKYAFTVRGMDGKIIAYCKAQYDESCGFVMDLSSNGDAPLFATVEIVARAAEWLHVNKVKGVLIHTEGKNVNRKFYKRLGFVPVKGCPGLQATSLDEAMAVLQRFLPRK